MNAGLAATIGAGLTLISGAVGLSEAGAVRRLTWSHTLAIRGMALSGEAQNVPRETHTSWLGQRPETIPDRG